jgi:hypothetical protein
MASRVWVAAVPGAEDDACDVLIASSWTGDEPIRRVADQTTPWSIIASATLMKPAMFAPST